MHAHAIAPHLPDATVAAMLYRLARLADRRDEAAERCDDLAHNGGGALLVSADASFRAAAAAFQAAMHLAGDMTGAHYAVILSAVEAHRADEDAADAAMRGESPHHVG